MSVPNFSLDGRIAVVTGAGRGIGRTLAIGLAAAGAMVIAAGRNVNALTETRTAIEDEGGTCAVQKLDVGDVGSITSAFADIARVHGRVDILVNNAGMESVAASLDVDEALWDRIVDTNLKGAFFCAQAAAKLMTQGGAILNLASLTSEIGIPTAVPYGSSKTGLVGMTRALSAEWARLGIRVNGIGPGYFRTGMTEEFFQNKDWEANMLGKIPLGRFGAQEDLVGAAVFLCSSAAAYVTGQVLYIDGGFLASV